MELAIVLSGILLPFFLFAVGLAWAVHQTNLAERETPKEATTVKPVGGAAPNDQLRAA